MFVYDFQNYCRLWFKSFAIPTATRDRVYLVRFFLWLGHDSWPKVWVRWPMGQTQSLGHESWPNHRKNHTKVQLYAGMYIWAKKHSKPIFFSPLSYAQRKIRPMIRPYNKIFNVVWNWKKKGAHRNSDVTLQKKLLISKTCCIPLNLYRRTLVQSRPDQTDS